MDITIKPIVTEKATQLTERRGQYTFAVSPEANKYQIKDLIERIYGVKVKGINTAQVRADDKSRYTKGGYVRGKSARYKKVFVTLAPDQTIDIYSNI